jgi:hypothetical protein
MIKQAAWAVGRWLIKFWVHLVVTACGIAMMVGLTLMVSGVVRMQKSIEAIERRAEEAHTDAEVAKTNQGKLLESIELNRKQWELLKKHNDELAVPEVVEEKEEPTPSPKERIIVTPKHAKPTPTPKVKVRTVIKYKRQPTPKPWWKR